MKTPEIDIILQLVDKHDVTAYKMAQHTGLTEQGIGKILSRKTKPRRTTTKLILDYLNSLEGVEERSDNPRIAKLQDISANCKQSIKDQTRFSETCCIWLVGFSQMNYIRCCTQYGG